MFSGQYAVVTGGSRGIGNAAVSLFVRQGAHVCYLSRHEAANHEELVRAADSSGGSVVWKQADMADEASITGAFEEILREFGKIDILVNNAGITRDGLLMRMKRSDWDEVMAVNLTAVFIACRSVARAMAKARGGVIINISSVVGLMGNAGQANYAASKAGIIGFSKSLAKELASRSVRVNVVAPGYIKTDMTEGLPEEIQDNLKQTIPLSRLGAPEDIAEAVAFLASEKAAYITGQVLSVDGGMTMS